MLKTRDKRLDILKGFSILLVVVGHNIQMLKGPDYANALFFENFVFSLIYTFHMPLFMLISGYLFFGTMNKYPVKTIVFKRTVSLVLPALSWGLLQYISNILVNGVTPNLIGFGVYLLSSVWFLWAVFYCSIGVLVGNKMFNDNFLFHLIVLLAMLLLPDVFNKGLYGFMYPFFVSGYYAKKCDFKIAKINVWVLMILYLMLFTFWDTDKYIYTSGLTLMGRENLLNMLLIDAYRWLIGFTGSLIVIKFIDSVYNIYQKQYAVLTYIGKNSLGIYLISTYITNYIFLDITLFTGWNEFEYTLICIALSVIVTGISLVICSIFKKSNVLNLFLLGSNLKVEKNNINKELNQKNMVH